MPLLDRVLVQRVKAEVKTAGGIFLPESAVKELNEAKVLAVGPGGVDKEGKRIPMSVQPGDKVVIPQYGGSSIKVGDDEFHILRDHEYVSSGIDYGGTKANTVPDLLRRLTSRRKVFEGDSRSGRSMYPILYHTPSVADASTFSEKAYPATSITFGLHLASVLGFVYTSKYISALRN